MASPVRIQATVTAVETYGDTVFAYRFKPVGRVPKFHPGQFLHLALDDYQPHLPWPESRVFSIASPPTARREELAIAISVKGPYTKRMADELQVGASCWLKFPYGEFLYPPDVHLTLIAGGVGITPYLSLIQEQLLRGQSQPTTLVYGVRSADQTLFPELLASCSDQLPNFHLQLHCEDGSLPNARVGTLDIHAIHAEAPADTTYFLSGPPAMIGSFRKALAEKGVPAERIVIDDWGDGIQ